MVIGGAGAGTFGVYADYYTVSNDEWTTQGFALQVLMMMMLHPLLKQMRCKQVYMTQLLSVQGIASNAAVKTLFDLICRY